MVGFKPDPIIVRSDSQSGDAIQELVQGGELHWIHLFGKFRADMESVFDDLRSHRRREADRVVMTKPPSRRVWPTARAPPDVKLSLTTRRAIEPCSDDTEELSMKAPMSVSKPTDLG